MATLYLLVDSNNVIQHAQYENPASVPSGQTIQTIDDTATNASATLGNPTAYAWENGAVARRPYWTLSYASDTVTATLNLAPAAPPASVTFSVAGQTYTETVTSGAATLALSVHPSVANQEILITASASGTYTGQLNLGGSEKQVALQVYTPSGGTPTVAPVGPGSLAYLEGYFAAQSTSMQSALANIATQLDILNDIVFGVLVPNAQQAAYTQFVPTADQATALSDIKDSLLPNIYTTLSNAHPSGGAQIRQFKDLLAGYAATYANTEAYESAVKSIPGLE